MGLFDFFRKGNDYSDADKAKLDGIDPSKYVTLDQYNELKNQLRQIIEFMPDHVDTSQFALKSDIPSVEGLATVNDIPKPVDTSQFALKKDIPNLPDLSAYALKKDIPDTVKYIENSNATSKIKKIRLSIEDKATFKPDSNPADNIAHTI